MVKYYVLFFLLIPWLLQLHLVQPMSTILKLPDEMWYGGTELHYSRG